MGSYKYSSIFKRKDKLKQSKYFKKRKNVKVASKLKYKSPYNKRKSIRSVGKKKESQDSNDFKGDTINTQYHHPIQGGRNNAALYFKETHTDERPKRCFKSISVSSSNEKCPRLSRKSKEVQAVTSCGATINKKLKQAYDIVNSALKFGVSAGVLEMFDGTYRMSTRLTTARNTPSDDEDSETLVTKPSKGNNSSSTLFRNSNCSRSSRSSNDTRGSKKQRTPTKETGQKSSSQEKNNSSKSSKPTLNKDKSPDKSDKKSSEENVNGKQDKSISGKSKKKDSRKEKSNRKSLQKKQKKSGKVKKSQKKKVRWSDGRKHKGAPVKTNLLEKKVMANAMKVLKPYHSDDQLYKRSNFSQILQDRTKPKVEDECYDLCECCSRSS